MEGVKGSVSLSVMDWDSELLFEGGCMLYELSVPHSVELREGSGVLRFLLPGGIPAGSVGFVEGVCDGVMLGDDGLEHDASVRCGLVSCHGDRPSLGVGVYSYEDFRLSSGVRVARVWLLSPYKGVEKS